jgi:hypothetical protein
MVEGIIACRSRISPPGVAFNPYPGYNKQKRAYNLKEGAQKNV